MSVPRISATAESAPIARPPMIVSGIMYRLRIDSRTRGSFLNPDICKPDARIFFACVVSSMPEVFTQKTAKSAEKAR